MKLKEVPWTLQSQEAKRIQSILHVSLLNFPIKVNFCPKFTNSNWSLFSDISNLKIHPKPTYKITEGLIKKFQNSNSDQISSKVCRLIAILDYLSNKRRLTFVQWNKLKFKINDSAMTANWICQIKQKFLCSCIFCHRIKKTFFWT